jgi:hypothetical protein
MRLLVLFAGVTAGAFALAALRLDSGDVAAGTALKMDVGELSRRAELVVEARVLGMDAVEVADGRIETEFQLEVQRTFRGEDVVYRAVRLPGGLLPGGRGMLLAGMPSLRVGESAILFLTAPTETGMRMPVGLAQGKMQVVTSPAGEKLVVVDRAGLALVQTAGGQVVEGAEADGALVLPYAHVLAQIEAACAGALDNDDRAHAPASGEER